MVFNGERRGRSWLFVVGSLVAAALIGCGIWIMTTREALGLSPWFMIGGVLVGVIASVSSKLPRAGTVELSPGGKLRLSWRRRPASATSGVLVGHWYDRLSGTPLGLFADIDGVRIGGRGHEDSRYRLDARSRWKVDIALAATDFEQLLRALGVHADGQDRHAFTAEMPANAYRARNAIIAAVVVSGLLSAVPSYFVLTSFLTTGNVTKAYEQVVGSPPRVISYSVLVIVGVFLAAYWPRGFAILFGRPPGLRLLQVRPDGVTFARPNGRPIESASWASVAARPLWQPICDESGQEIGRMPLLELAIGGRKPILISRSQVARGQVAWPPYAETTSRSADYILGDTHWEKLVDALKPAEGLSPKSGTR